MPSVGRAPTSLTKAAVEKATGESKQSVRALVCILSRYNLILSLVPWDEKPSGRDLASKGRPLTCPTFERRFARTRLYSSDSSESLGQNTAFLA